MTCPARVGGHRRSIRHDLNATATPETGGDVNPRRPWPARPAWVATGAPSGMTSTRRPSRRWAMSPVHVGCSAGHVAGSVRRNPAARWDAGLAWVTPAWSGGAANAANTLS